MRHGFVEIIRTPSPLTTTAHREFLILGQVEGNPFVPCVKTAGKRDRVADAWAKKASSKINQCVVPVCFSSPSVHVCLFACMSVFKFDWGGGGGAGLHLHTETVSLLGDSSTCGWGEKHLLEFWVLVSYYTHLTGASFVDELMNVCFCKKITMKFTQQMD